MKSQKSLLCQFQIMLSGSLASLSILNMSIPFAFLKKFNLISDLASSFSPVAGLVPYFFKYGTMFLYGEQEKIRVRGQDAGSS